MQYPSGFQRVEFVRWLASRRCRSEACVVRLAGDWTGKADHGTRISYRNRIVRIASFRVGWSKRCTSKAGDGDEQGEEADQTVHLW